MIHPQRADSVRALSIVRSKIGRPLCELRVDVITLQLRADQDAHTLTLPSAAES